MNDDVQRDQMQRLETEIGKLVTAIELGRTVNLVAQAVLVVAGIVIFAVTIGRIDPMAVIGALAALGIGIVFLAWSRHRQGLLIAVLKAVEAHKAELADVIELPPAGDDRR